MFNEDNSVYWRIILAVGFASGLTARGIRKKSLAKSGAIAAWIVGFLTMASSIRFGLLLILFYQSSSMLTKYRSDIKARFEEDFKEGGQRSAAQVLACSLLATLIAVLYAYRWGADQPLDFTHDPSRSQLLCAFVGHYACCNGDTWASELGILSPGTPRLVTSLFRRSVPRGTNGGMSMCGTAASIAGGAFIGAGYTIAGILLEIGDQAGGKIPPWAYMTILGAICGFMGSLVDSIIGGLLQPSWYCPERKHIVKRPSMEEVDSGAVRLISGTDVLNNEQVNVISVLVTTALAPRIGELLW